MKKLIHLEYQQWLKIYQYNVKDKSTNAIAKRLINELPKAQSIEDVMQILATEIKPQTAQSSSQSVNVYGPMSFYAKLTKLHEDLYHLNQNYLLAIENLQALEQVKTGPLIDLLNALNSNPMAVLHVQEPSLLQALNAGHVVALFEYIEKLPQEKMPTNPPVGSFNALTPIDINHAHCLKLLNNVSVHLDEKNPLSDRANCLLQTALLIYQDLYLEEISLEDIDEPNLAEDKVQKRDACTIC